MDRNDVLQFSFEDQQGREVTMKARVARTPEQRDRGLMYVREMPKDEGMIFVFEHSQILNFWMKNTLIPLDIIFLDEEWRIVNIASATPCEVEPCPIYASAAPSRYVLEMNAGLSRNFGLSEGYRLQPM